MAPGKKSSSDKWQQLPEERMETRDPKPLLTQLIFSQISVPGLGNNDPESPHFYPTPSVAFPNLLLFSGTPPFHGKTCFFYIYE